MEDVDGAIEIEFLDHIRNNIRKKTYRIEHTERKLIRQAWPDLASAAQVEVLEFISLCGPRGLWSVVMKAMSSETHVLLPSLIISFKYFEHIPKIYKPRITKKALELLKQEGLPEQFACLEILRQARSRDVEMAMCQIADRAETAPLLKAYANTILVLHGKADRIDIAIAQLDSGNYHALSLDIWLNNERLGLSKGQQSTLRMHVEAMFRRLKRTPYSEDKQRLLDAIDASLQG